MILQLSTIKRNLLNWNTFWHTLFVLHLSLPQLALVEFEIVSIRLFRLLHLLDILRVDSTPCYRLQIALSFPLILIIVDSHWHIGVLPVISDLHPIIPLIHPLGIILVKVFMWSQPILRSLVSLSLRQLIDIGTSPLVAGILECMGCLELVQS